MITPNCVFDKSEGSLWCITTYFNPLGLQNRLNNFCLFYERMMHHGANVLVAEVALHDRAFQLSKIVAPEHMPIEIEANVISWHKENLLNRLLEFLPDDCDKVCWIDSDVLFQTDDWQWNICEALQKFRLVQGFSWVANLPKGIDFIDPIEINSFPIGFADCSRFYGYIHGRRNKDIKQAEGHPGMVWAARRDLIDECGFYNECILGGADLLISKAATYDHFIPGIAANYTRFQLSSYIPWAQKFCDMVDGSIGFVDNHLFHLYHGSMNNRGYRKRVEMLKQLEYNPKKDLVMSKDGLWNFTKDGERLITPSRNFFIHRNEDGVI